MSRPVTKWNAQVRRGDDMPDLVREAVRSGHHGAGRARCCSTCPRTCSSNVSRLPRRSPRRHRPAAAALPPRPCLQRRRRAGCCHGRAPGPLWRRRPHQLRRGGLRRVHRLVPRAERALHADADGPGRLPGVGPAVSRHAGHARHAGSQPRDASGRPGGVRRRPVRRPRHRRARGLLSACAQDPHRHRPRQHQQGGEGGRPAGGRLRARAAALLGRIAGRPAGSGAPGQRGGSASPAGGRDHAWPSCSAPTSSCRSS